MNSPSTSTNGYSTSSQNDDTPNKSNKKTRRKPRWRKSTTNDNSNEVQAMIFESTKLNTNSDDQTIDHSTYCYEEKVWDKITFSFTINAVQCENIGKFIRESASTNKKRIRLKSFLTNLGKPAVFETKLSNALSNLIISKTGTCERSGKKSLRNLNISPTIQNSICEKKKRKRCNSKKLKNQRVEEYISEQDAIDGLNQGIYFKGFLRINPKNHKDAYVNNEDSSIPDYYLPTVADRNCALDGDEVVLVLKDPKLWVDGQKTTKVVHILQMVHPRIAVGSLKLPKTDKQLDIALFYPRDKRFPILEIPSISWPPNFRQNAGEYAQNLFSAKLIEWKGTQIATGHLMENLGTTGDLQVETKAILSEFCLDTTPFPQSINRFLPKTKQISDKEFSYREDIRKECVFTIDPESARDLDDAVSVKELANGNYEVGVHISDAAFYLEEGTEFDELVRAKATTIYMVQIAYHMLPIELCLHCSLLPGEDKLTFSVFWEITPEAEIISTRFTRTIMNSCVKLAYEHAQKMIDEPDKNFDEFKNDFPTVLNGFTLNDISKIVNVLWRISDKLREKRTNNGALRIDQTKLYFTLDPNNGEPIDFNVYKHSESHRLIEDFMLLANISVAKRIYESFPDIAFLRCHDPPKQTMLRELQKNLEIFGIHIDVDSSGGIYRSMQKYITDDLLGQYRGVVLNHLLAKSMTRAHYFCASEKLNVDGYCHYALSVPIYTHFTSPIRRYADIMVHRLLAASLDYTDAPNWDKSFVTSVAKNCNTLKYNAKRAGDASSELYLVKYIADHQPYVQDVVVIDVKEKNFDGIVLETGSVVRIYQNNLETGATWSTESSGTGKGKKVVSVTIKYPEKPDLEMAAATLIIEMFSVVKVSLKQKDTTYKLEPTLLRP